MRVNSSRNAPDIASQLRHRWRCQRRRNVLVEEGGAELLGCRREPSPSPPCRRRWPSRQSHHLRTGGEQPFRPRHHHIRKY